MWRVALCIAFLSLLTETSHAQLIAEHTTTPVDVTFARPPAVEAGQEWNKLTDLKFEGTLANNVTEVDFSGPYISAGLIFSGIPSWITPGGITFGK